MVVEQGQQVDHGAADVVDVVELLLRDPAGLEQLGDALLGPAGVGEATSQVASRMALDRASVRHQRGHRDRLPRQELGLLEPVGQHQHLRQPAQHGGPPPGRGLRGHQLHPALVRRERVLGVRRHPQVAAQPLVQPAMQVQVLGVHARDRLADQLGGAVGVRGQVGNLGRPVQQAGPAAGRGAPPRPGPPRPARARARSGTATRRRPARRRPPGPRPPTPRAPGPGRRPPPSAGPAGRRRALPCRRARGPG